jgi:mannose-6-phosphate isomerase-like protein (cupin superfamily)
MSWKVVDLNTMDGRDESGGKRILYSSETFHMWMHTDEPGMLRGRIVEGGAQELHRHFADEVFYCVQGELTIRFGEPEGIEVVPAGAFVVVPAGQLYSLENTGSETMILLGARAEAHNVGRMADDGHEVVPAGAHEWAVQLSDEEQRLGESQERWAGAVFGQ